MDDVCWLHYLDRRLVLPGLFFFFFNDTATTEIYTLSLHDALPISDSSGRASLPGRCAGSDRPPCSRDRKSTRLNSSHLVISYAVFCLKKKTTAAYTSSALHDIIPTVERTYTSTCSTRLPPLTNSGP